MAEIVQTTLIGSILLKEDVYILVEIPIQFLLALLLT